MWKRPPTTPKVLEDGEVGKFYGVDAFIVGGHVTGVAHGRRGVPYYGGPRYTITWENGEVDEEITATDMLNHYKETPQSLGCSNTLDEWLSDQLYDIASTAGCILEAQRVKTFLIELRQRIQRNNMKANIIAEIGLESIATMLSGTREISLVGYNTQKAEMNSLVDFFPVKNINSNTKTGKVVEEEYQHTVYTVGQLMLGRSLMSELLITADNFANIGATTGTSTRTRTWNTGRITDGTDERFRANWIYPYNAQGNPKVLPVGALNSFNLVGDTTTVTPMAASFMASVLKEFSTSAVLPCYT